LKLTINISRAFYDSKAALLIPILAGQSLQPKRRNPDL
jgi:hypothetical protein